MSRTPDHGERAYDAARAEAAFRQVADRKAYAFSQLYVDRARLLSAQDVNGAMRLLREYLSDRDDPGAWMLLAETLLMQGQELEARAAARTGLERCASPHVKDVILAGTGATVAIVDDVAKVLYVPVPKCSSTTVKNLISRCVFERDGDLDVHARLRRLERWISFEDLEMVYADYFRFAVTRQAAERVSSYYYGNVRRGLLRVEAWGLASFCGLATEPDPSSFVERFFQYRALFPDFRHHTDRLNGYLGRQPAITFDRVYGMEEMDECRLALEHIYGRQLDLDRKMARRVTGEPIQFSAEMRAFYAAEPI